MLRCLRLTSPLLCPLNRPAGALLAAAQLGTAQLPLMWTPSSNPPLGSAILWSGAFADANTAVFVGTMSSLTSATILVSWLVKATRACNLQHIHSMPQQRPINLLGSAVPGPRSMFPRNPLLQRSTDGGQTFSNAPSPKLNLKGVAAVPGSTTTAWAVGPVDSSNYKAVSRLGGCLESLLTMPARCA